MLRLLFPSESRVLRGRFLLICFLVFALGCGGKRHSVKHAEVSGTVKYKGKPVTGGSLQFVTEDGFNSSGRISEDGSYSINAPVGSVKISIDNRMLQRKGMENAMKGAGPRPGAPEPEPIKGKYMRIPMKYYDVGASPLSYTVKPGQQTYNIELTD